MRQWILISMLLACGIMLMMVDPNHLVLAEPDDCEVLGWFPQEFGLKDHSVFTYMGNYYIASIDTTDNTHFAYGVSSDLCHWTTLRPILEERPPRSWDERLIWAPQVIFENDKYHMFYTSVDANFSQRIALAITTNPADPESWKVQTSWSFFPNHENTAWRDGAFADCRDPNVFQFGDLYYMLYTSRDINGGIIGLATATSLKDEWKDFGSILTLDGPGIPESRFAPEWRR